MVNSFIFRSFCLPTIHRVNRSTTLFKPAKQLLSRLYSSTKMDRKLNEVTDVDIDDAGRFKYILIKVYAKEQADGTEPSKFIVRGYKRATWHGMLNK